MAGYDYRQFAQNVIALDGDRCWLADYLRAKQQAYPVDYSPGLLECDGPLDFHHLFPKQRLKQECRSWASDEVLADILQDGRNGIACCRRHHDLLERRLVVLRREELPHRVFEFAEELGLTGWIERYFLPQRSAA